METIRKNRRIEALDEYMNRQLGVSLSAAIDHKRSHRSVSGGNEGRLGDGGLKESPISRAT